MLITKNPFLNDQIYDNIRKEVDTERTGIHVSDLSLCLRKAYYRKKGLSPPPTKETCLLWATGYAFQAFMFPKEIEIPVIVDGIHCTPDISSGIEVKSTRQSSKKFSLETMGHWNIQILAYCKALNTLEYDLSVIFLMGNYAPPFPLLDSWHIETTEEEVESNWVYLLERKELLETALKNNIAPEPLCAPWEGKYCENIHLCKETPCYRSRKLGAKG